MKMEEGIVKNVYPERGTVRVERQANDGVISSELKISFPGTLKNQFYSMPSIEEHVLCVWPDKTKSDGFVIGCIYSDVTKPPVQDANKHYVRFKDGSYIEYDTSTHETRIYGVGDIFIESQKTIYTTNLVVSDNVEIADTLTVKHINVESIDVDNLNVGTLTASRIVNGSE